MTVLSIRPASRQTFIRTGARFEFSDATFCSWGNYDRNQLAQDAQRHGIAPPLGPDHWNLKEAFAQTGGSRRRGLGVFAALHKVGLDPIGTHHRGIDDARNIARLLPYVLGRNPTGEAAPTR